MKVVLCGLATILVFFLAHAGAFVFLQEVKAAPGDSNACEDSANNSTLKIGDSLKDADCLKVTCQKMGGKLFLTTEGCGVSAPPEDSNCDLITNSTQEYPLCCPHVICR